MRLIAWSLFLVAILLGISVADFTKQDPTEQRWCDILGLVSYDLQLVTGCPHILDVSIQQSAQIEYRITYTEGVPKRCSVQMTVGFSGAQINITGFICAHASGSIHGVGVTGGYNQADPTAQQYSDVLFDFVDLGLLSRHNMFGVLITNVEKQVVSGYNYKYTLQTGDQVCSLTLFVQDWTQRYEVHNNPCRL
ncbi:uncharacterized protein LOC127871502 [Dreissena polymorpha]|uniref:uncharacterized protein LOC127871502 n=1 Tax=Dreissena polymorpha TaxID=45954 RepID=UPI002264B606|nr:uncharacterized protein LOC127871502 [Dreissena polymorpha]